MLVGRRVAVEPPVEGRALRERNAPTARRDLVDRDDECMAGFRAAHLDRTGECVAVVQLCVALDDVSIDVLDIRSLKPLDEDALLASAAKTGRVVIVQEAPRTCGFAAELAAILAEKAILDLRGPVLRVTGYDVPYPYWQIEDAYMPSAERVVAAARRLLQF